MNPCRCPICQGETHEIRAKLVCRQCGAILETCCEGGPMSPRGDGTASRPAPAEQSVDQTDG